MKAICVVAAIGMAAMGAAATAASRPGIVVQVTGVDKPGGAVYASLCRRDEMATMRCGRTAGRKVVRPGVVEVQFPDAAADSYMVLAFHDANGNKRLDRNQWGAPAEPAGASGRPVQGRMPSFDESSFVHSRRSTVVKVQLR